MLLTNQIGILLGTVDPFRRWPSGYFDLDAMPMPEDGSGLPHRGPWADQQRRSYARTPQLQDISFSWPCPFRKSYPDVLMMQSGQDWDGDNDTGPLDCSMQGRIFL
jgi:hypothetical protein